MPDITRQAAKDWKELPSVEKEKYIQMSKQKQEEYRKAMNQFIEGKAVQPVKKKMGRPKKIVQQPVENVPSSASSVSSSVSSSSSSDL